MPLRIYDTKAGKKIEFTPLEAGHVKMYVCGITAYDYCHIGHARSALVFDMIAAYLRYRGYKVTYVRNFTDIDDKIINRANEQGTTCEALSSRFIDEFHKDMAILGVAPPTVEPKATEHIAEIIEIIETLIGKGLAYEANGDVYFSVRNFGSYGSLSGRDIEELRAGARISVSEVKKDPLDFALWKSSKPGEPTWDSPWGPGRPGWHIECSAMSRKYLGDTFDIHGGGEDLVFPHHENEAAQSVGATGQPFARHWIHHAFVTIRDEKMSKSLKNFLTIREVLAEHHPEALRLAVFSTHYRHPLDYSDETLRDALSGLTRLYNCMAAVEALPDGDGGAQAAVTAKDREKLAAVEEKFTAAMDNDFNTAQALGVLFEAVKDLNRLTRSLPRKPAASDIDAIRAGASTVKALANILGLVTRKPADFINERQEAHLASVGLSREEVNTMIQRRIDARKAKDWATADAIRNDLLAKKIELEDGPQGTSWRVLS